MGRDRARGDGVRAEIHQLQVQGRQEHRGNRRGDRGCPPVERGKYSYQYVPDRSQEQGNGGCDTQREVRLININN